MKLVDDVLFVSSVLQYPRASRKSTRTSSNPFFFHLSNNAFFPSRSKSPDSLFTRHGIEYTFCVFQSRNYLTGPRRLQTSLKMPLNAACTAVEIEISILRGTYAHMLCNVQCATLVAAFLAPEMARSFCSCLRASAIGRALHKKRGERGRSRTPTLPIGTFTVRTVFGIHCH